MSLQRLVGAFPQPMSMVVAYGSSVFSQGHASDGDGTRLLDLLIAVDDPVAWHRLNMAKHAEHYTGAFRLLGPRAVARFQDWGGAHCFFMPFVRVNDVPCKYGVIATSSLLRDLTQWDTLYCSGRLHKPVKVVSCNEPQLVRAMQDNLGRALNVALLHLSAVQRAEPTVVSEHALYACIAGLSYKGDVRMGVGESPTKVLDIVNNNLAAFRELYAPYVEALLVEKVLARSASNDLILCDRAALERAVPAKWHSPDALARLVRRVSAVQSVKGLVTAGRWCPVLRYTVGCH
jgi:translocator assembly and maintenance protein 41